MTASLKKKEHRRQWSIEDKTLIVDQANKPGANVSQIAEQNELKPNQIFRWRKQLAAAAGNTNSLERDSNSSSLSAYRAMLTAVRSKSALAEELSHRIATEVRGGSGNTYNLCLSLNNLTSACTKLQERENFLLETIFRLEEEARKEALRAKEKPIDMEIQVAAERLLFKLVKETVEEEKAEAKKVAAAKENERLEKLRRDLEELA